MNVCVKKLNLNFYGEFFTIFHHGKLLENVNRFLIWAKDNLGRQGKKLARSSQRQYCYHMKYLFDILEENDIEWNKITRYEMRKIVNIMDSGIDGINRDLINTRSTLWCQFYNWCSQNNYYNEFRFNYTLSNAYINHDDDMLSYTKTNQILKKTEFHLPKLQEKRIYKTISPQDWVKLATELKKIDIVYEQIAFFMITTGLRINGALQLKKTSFLPPTELSQNDYLSFYYIPKGEFSTGRKIPCTIPFEVWENVSLNLKTIRLKRVKIFKQKYKKLPSSMFLTKTGNEVKDFDVWGAFRQASSNLGMKITSHMLRHTFATWMVLSWAESRGIKSISESFYKDIHDFLQDQLGHKNISTTKKYCKTATNYQLRKILPRVSAKAMGKEHIKNAYNMLNELLFTDKNNQ